MDMEICGNFMIGHSNGSPNPQPPPPNPTNILELDWPNSNSNSNSICCHHHHFQFHPDPHLVCLNLGKRHYFEDVTPMPPPPSFMPMPGKRGKQPQQPPPLPPLYTPLATTAVPRCQVEGCHVALLHSKDYHRRHRVCEMHSKAPKVMLLGLQQRFCQQCSRFHVISEFDDSKRSCRRRLAGHNERRRKSSQESVAAARNCSQENKSMRGRIAYIASPSGRALSLLSSKNESWANSSELSQRSSAALRELIAENRAAILARQLILDHTATAADDFGVVGFHQQHGLYYEQQQQQQNQNGWERMQMHDQNDCAQVTLDLMQPPNTAFGLLSVRAKSNEQQDQECCELWNSFQDQQSHVV